MARWDRPGVPHKGWIEVGCIDIREDEYDDSDVKYETCEMCHNERIRYVHILKHPEYDGVIRVGCVCACKMTEDYDAAPEEERRMRNRATRKRNFLKQKWQLNYKGNYVLRYKGRYITAIRKNGTYGFVCDGKWVWRYKRRPIVDLDTLKMAVFDEFDET